MTAEGKGPRDPNQMADPKLVLEAEPEDLVLESIPPDSEAASRSLPATAARSAPKVVTPARGPVLPAPKASGIGRVPPMKPGSGPQNEKPPVPAPPPALRGTPASGVASPQVQAPHSDNLETIPAPPKDLGSSRWKVPTSPGQDRSSVTARESLPRPAQVPSPPGSVPEAPVPRTTTSRLSAPGALPSTTPARGTSPIQGSAPRSSSAMVVPPVAGVRSVTGSHAAVGFKASGAFAAAPYSEVHQQSALVRLLSPFIEDPRPGWLLATYFLVGVAIGVGAAFGLWGQP